MFMTIPKVFIGELNPSEDAQTGRINEAYSQVRSAYGATALAVPQWTEGMLPTFKGAASDIAARVVSDLFSNVDFPPPTALIDCRSATMLDCPAPTYRLAAGCGLHRVTCWSLSGLGGNEVGEALLQLSALGVPAAVISAVQAIQWPDTRIVVGGYPLGDAGAAVMVSTARPSNGKAWHVRGCAIAQLRIGESPEPHHFHALASEACHRGGVPVTAIRWWVAQHVSAAFVNCVEAAFPRQSWDHTSRPHSAVNFGCADVFVTLALSTFERSGIGGLVFGGRFGSLGLVLIDD